MGYLNMKTMLNAGNKKHALPSMQQFSSICMSEYPKAKTFWDVPTRSYTSPQGIPGSGVGKGGGAGGSVRESGGGLGKFGAAQEEGYFHHKQVEQLRKIKKQLQQDNPDLSQKKDK